MTRPTLPRTLTLLLGFWLPGLDGLAQQAPVPAEPARPAAPAAPAPPRAADDDRTGLRRIEAEPPAPAERESRASRGSGARRDQMPVGNHFVPAGARMREIVSLFGSTLIEGEVISDAVSIFGRTEIARGAKVGGAAVAVLGRLSSEGEVGQDGVSVLGGARIDGRVGGDVVVVLGNLHLGSNAVIERDLVVVGGQLTRDPGAVVRGDQVHVPLVPVRGDIEWLTTWFERCVKYARPLAFGANLGWAWLVAGAILLLHLFVALVFPRGITACAETLETRPGGSVLASLLTVILTPVAFVLLAITIVGALVVPLLGLFLLAASLVGKTVMLAWLGRRVVGLRAGAAPGSPVIAVLVGGVIVALIYTIPVIGFLAFKLLSWLGLGVVIYTVALGMRRERAASSGPAIAAAAVAAPAEVARAPAAPPPSPAGVAGSVPEVASPAGVPAPMAFSVVSPTLPPEPPPAPNSSATVPPASVPSSVPPVAVDVSWPRAGFLIRMAAMVLDAVLIGLILNLLMGLLPRVLHFHNGPGGPLVILSAVYAACLWKLRGTTIGGIVFGLKVVRLDQRELDWATVIVRALGAFLSLAVGGLGFIWVAFDTEKQSWHDKIAGTTVVRVPKGVSLV